jgi:hypothetical protein
MNEIDSVLDVHSHHQNASGFQDFTFVFGRTGMSHDLPDHFYGVTVNKVVRM